ncbi:branched-chain amino acid ABC transporter permease [Roseomonas sp. BN140053]|uniref:branched-chain amino acid ABC transporter permease n=1 Tax=Roseomonas sp. BN140053 TaxID=3391898 RepID=UPI0039E8D2C2
MSGAVEQGPAPLGARVPVARSAAPRSFAWLGILAVFAAACAVPVLLPGQPYLLQILTLALCYAVPAMGLNLLFGYAGLVSLGQMGFAGVGAYTAALLLKGGVPFLPALGCAAVAGGLVGLLVGIPCLRLRSHFFIIVTLAVGMILFSLFNNLDGLTGGAEGLPGIPRPQPLDLGFAVLDFRRPLGFYWLALAVFAAVFLLQAAVVRSDFGRVLAAIRQDEALAAARGVNVFAHKLAVFALSAAIAGIGGALKVVLLRAAAPLSFELGESINLVLIVLLGGPGFLLGPLLGSLLFVALPEFLRAANEWRLIVFGLVLVVLALGAPKGISGLLAGLLRRVRRAA